MSDSLFDDLELDIDCPECGREIYIKLDDLGKTVVCPNCSTEIYLEGDESVDSVKDSLNELDDILDDFCK